jgi:hypothetical protein
VDGDGPPSIRSDTGETGPAVDLAVGLPSGRFVKSEKKRVRRGALAPRRGKDYGQAVAVKQLLNAIEIELIAGATLVPRSTKTYTSTVWGVPVVESPVAR